MKGRYRDPADRFFEKVVAGENDVIAIRRALRGEATWRGVCDRITGGDQ